MDNNVAVFFFKLLDKNYRNFDMTTVLKLSTMLTDICQRYNPPNEVVLVADMKGVSLINTSYL
jgi:hypothetical protein